MNHPLQKCIVLGGGGHAKVLIDAIQACENIEAVGILDRDQKLWGKEIFGVPVLGSDEQIDELRGDADWFIVGIGSVGNPETRIKFFEKGIAAGLRPIIVIHPSSIVSPHAEIGAGSMLYAGSIVNPGARIGQNVIVNTGAIIEHDCELGDHAHIATGARLAGTVKIGRGAHIGAGATVIQNCEIGDFAVVGAGAVVIKSVPSAMTVIGNPARILHIGSKIYGAAIDMDREL